jgi:vacuolar-type H+-ATPase subunit E/Vma4
VTGTVAAAEAWAQDLAPVRKALLRRARAEADHLRAGAARDRDRLLGDARRRAEEIRHDAEREGRAAGAAAAAADVAAAGRAARQIVFDARRRAYHDLVREVAGRLGRWMSDPAVVAALRAGITDALAPGAVVHADGEALTGTNGGRRIEVSPAGLADAAVRRLGSDVERLWQP